MDRNSLPDDPTIGPDAILWRRIHPAWIVVDEKQGALRISSAAFSDSNDGDPMSVFLAQEIEGSGGSATKVLEGLAEYGVASILAGMARSLSQRLAKSYDLGLGHVSVIGHKTKTIKRCMAAAARWVIRIPVWSIERELRKHGELPAFTQGKDLHDLLHPKD